MAEDVLSMLQGTVHSARDTMHVACLIEGKVTAVGHLGCWPLSIVSHPSRGSTEVTLITWKMQEKCEEIYQHLAMTFHISQNTSALSSKMDCKRSFSNLAILRNVVPLYICYLQTVTLTTKSTTDRTPEQNVFRQGKAYHRTKVIFSLPHNSDPSHVDQLPIRAYCLCR